ncbi:Type 1 glutamine amidotransferase-like domain-containing protein [Niallia sp. 03133]|uniref:Type 1 glutamine amidotransferase-like domain-containing protein n=1 Tax=Niallia sp. 03133 TaxID=3458060 RepID=UPI004044D700
MKIIRNIIAISGGGFSEEVNAYIDEYIIKQVSDCSFVNICFISTASNDADGYIHKFYQSFSTFNTSHITIKDMMNPSIQDIINTQHILYVGGGNTQFMLNKWKETNFDSVIKKAYNNGIILAGISAGAMCWFEKCYSERDDDTYEEFNGLGILNGSLCPHYNDPIRKKAFDLWESKQNYFPVYKLEDNQNLHFRNEELIARIDTKGCLCN